MTPAQVFAIARGHTSANDPSTTRSPQGASSDPAADAAVLAGLTFG